MEVDWFDNVIVSKEVWAQVQKKKRRRSKNTVHLKGYDCIKLCSTPFCLLCTLGSLQLQQECKKTSPAAVMVDNLLLFGQAVFFLPLMQIWMMQRIHSLAVCQVYAFDENYPLSNDNKRHVKNQRSMKFFKIRLSCA